MLVEVLWGWCELRMDNCHGCCSSRSATEELPGSRLLRSLDGWEDSNLVVLQE
jgi:hypothetical protein